MFIDFEIERLKKKYPMLTKWGHVGIFRFILSYSYNRRWRVRFLDKILPLRYSWESKIKKTLHKKIDKCYRLDIKKYKEFYDLLDEYKIKWFLGRLPCDLFLYSDGLKLETKAYVHRSERLDTFITKLNDEEFKDCVLSIYKLYKNEGIEIIGYSKIKQNFLIPI